MRGMTPTEKNRVSKRMELSKNDWDYKDMLKLIDWNERRHQEVSKAKLKQNSVVSLKNVETSKIKTRIFTPALVLNSVTKGLLQLLKQS